MSDLPHQIHGDAVSVVGPVYKHRMSVINTTSEQAATVDALRTVLQAADPRARVDGPDTITDEGEAVYEVRLGGYGWGCVAISLLGCVRVLDAEYWSEHG